MQYRVRLFGTFNGRLLSTTDHDSRDEGFSHLRDVRELQRKGEPIDASLWRLPDDAFIADTSYIDHNPVYPS